jgi:hypothetical protein
MPRLAVPLRHSKVLCPSLLALATGLTLATCESVTAPSCPLDGSWAWEWNRNPSGSSLDLSLSTAGIAVSGAGVAYGVGPTPTADSIVVSGVYAPRSLTFALTLSHRSGRVVTYAAVLDCPDKLEGTATSSGSPYALVFYRGINPLPGPSN